MQVTLQQRSHLHDAGLPVLPAPGYDVVTEALSRISVNLLDKHSHDKAKKALASNHDYLKQNFEAVRQKLDADSRGPSGVSWASSQFKNQLLSLRLPLQSSALAGLANFNSTSQLATAAKVLHRVAVAFTTTDLIDFVGTNGSLKRFSTSQIIDIFATNRLPHDTNDELRANPLSSYVIIWAKGHPYRCDILDNMRQPLQLHVLYEAVHSILQASHKTQDLERSVAWASSMLPRNVWSGFRARIRQSRANANSMDVIESAITSIALEDLVPESDQQRLRMSRGFSGNVYSDSTMGLSIYADGSCALRADHCVADGGVLCLVLEFLALGPTLNSSVDVVQASVQSLFLEIPQNMLQDLPDLNIREPDRIDDIFHLAQDPDVLASLRATKSFNFTIQLAFQCALLSTMGSEQWLIIEPTDIRSFSQGRCNPNFIVTSETRGFFEAVATKKSFEEILARFVAAINVYRANTMQVRSGSGVGPGAAILRGVVSDMANSSDKSVLLDLLRRFQTPDVMFTGVPYSQNINAAEAFLYSPNQMAMVYVGNTCGITTSLAATGKMAEKLPIVKSRFSSFLTTVGTVAASLSCISAMYPGRDLGSLLSTLQQPQPTSADPKKTSLAIHGGAGELFGLAPSEKMFVEFLMIIVVAIGNYSLALGEPALDVVQDCVVALENCPFFNAGKGAVFNAVGEHQLEACIVDGFSGSSGAVANTSTIKNPIIAARWVRDKVKPCLISGAEADRLAANCGLETVTNSYFSTSSRFNQWQAAKVNDHMLNHPQTVGAIALDINGKLAVASSTGGVVNKEPGRIGDTAVIGAGVYADQDVAIACSGDGDAFLQSSVATRIATAAKFSGACHGEIADKVLSKLKTPVVESMIQEVLNTPSSYSMPGDSSTSQACYEPKTATGAVICMDREGSLIISQSSETFLVAAAEPTGKRWSAVQRRVEPFFNDTFAQTEASLSINPSTPGEAIVKTFNDDIGLAAPNICDMDRARFIRTLFGAKTASSLLKSATSAHRIALVTTSTDSINLIPLHGLAEDWQAVNSDEQEFHTTYPGYISSKNGPKMPEHSLDAMKEKINPYGNMDTTFLGSTDDNHLFARIIRCEEQQWRLWESRTHIAFLTPFGNTPGFTVLVPRRHLGSDILALEEADFYELMNATYSTMLVLKSKLGVKRVGIIFEGLELDYAHVKLIPIYESKNPVSVPSQKFSEIYLGHVSSQPGPRMSPYHLRPLHEELVGLGRACKTIMPVGSWNNGMEHFKYAINTPWYWALFQLWNGFFQSTVNYYQIDMGYAYALTPVTTDCISSPMGLGSDSLPVSVDLHGQSTYLADSMQFTLEYLLRFDRHSPGAYYIAPSFRGEDPDSSHLNQFFHAECEIRGGMDIMIKVAEGYVYTVTKSLYQRHRTIIERIAGTTQHIEEFLARFAGHAPFPRVTLDAAIEQMPNKAEPGEYWSWVADEHPQLGRKLTRKGERLLIDKHGGDSGAVWLTEMDHLSTPFYQAYVEGSGKRKAKAADLLMGLGETAGMGERHATAAEVNAALDHHEVDRASYKWYADIRVAQPLKTSGWGLGAERYFCWLLKHNDVRDLHLIPRLKGQISLP